ncbi:MAG: hypothetical protein AB7U97_00215 [Pirellulales bacterium]
MAARERRLAAFRTTKVELQCRNSAKFRLYAQNRAAVVVEGATVTSMHGATTMLALGLVLNTVGIGLFCWLIFTLAVYALPFFVAVSAGLMAYHSGAGILGAPLAGIAAGGVTLAIGQTAFAIAWSPILRAAIAAVFALPAAIAGYHVVFAISQLGMPSSAWREVFACLGAVFIGGTAWTRLAVFAEPRPFESGRVVWRAPRAVLSAAIATDSRSPPVSSSGLHRSAR